MSGFKEVSIVKEPVRAEKRGKKKNNEVDGVETVAIINLFMRKGI